VGDDDAMSQGCLLPGECQHNKTKQNKRRQTKKKKNTEMPKTVPRRQVNADSRPTDPPSASCNLASWFFKKQKKPRPLYLYRWMWWARRRETEKEGGKGKEAEENVKKLEKKR